MNAVLMPAVAALRFGVALLLVEGTPAKLRHPAAFAGIVGQYRLLPRRLVAPVATMMPMAESLIAISLVAWWAAPPLVAATVLLAAFAMAIGINLLRGRYQIDCGCGGAALRQQIGWPLAIRNLALAMLLACSIAIDPDMMRLGPILVGGVAAAIAFILHLAFAALPAPTLRSPEATA